MMRTFDYQKMPIVDIVNEILVDSSKKGASDIHLDPYEEYLLIRIRIDGDLFDYAQIPNNVRDYLVTRIKTISKMNITESRRPQDGAIKTTIQDIDLDLRVSALPVSGGEKIVIRILDYTRSMAGITELGFSEDNYKKLLEMISVPNGIILVTGATGSGKSTTVYSILQYLNRSTTNIITVEDPIEMDIKGINQVQVNSQIGLDFASALRSILRQDPNIIMIGEIRDTETAKIAVRASITGHLVLSTIHTNDSLNTIERLIDMDVTKYLLAAALEGIISQKLARQLCPHCRTLRETTEYEKQIFKVVTGKIPEKIYDTKGCEHCHDGFSGRIAIQEVLRINQKIRDALGENLTKEQLRELVYSSDVTTLLEDGLNKVIAGFTTFGEIINLIELDNDNKIYENFDLKKAILYTKQAHISKETGENITFDIEETTPPINNVQAISAQPTITQTPINTQVQMNMPQNQTGQMMPQNNSIQQPTPIINQNAMVMPNNQIPQQQAIYQQVSQMNMPQNGQFRQTIPQNNSIQQTVPLANQNNTTIPSNQMLGQTYQIPQNPQG